jgi:hypothetical protein
MFENLGTSDFVAVASAGISLIALALNVLITQRQTRISVETLKFNNDGQVMTWANRVAEAMSEAQHLCQVTTAPDARTHERSLTLASMLSALLDEGRWFFPNVGRKPTDVEKHGAYRGTRQAILDHVFGVYTCLEEFRHSGDKSREDLASAIATHRRAFVSEVQHAVDPRRRAWIMDRFRKF